MIATAFTLLRRRALVAWLRQVFRRRSKPATGEPVSSGHPDRWAEPARRPPPRDRGLRPRWCRFRRTGRGVWRADPRAPRPRQPRPHLPRRARARLHDRPAYLGPHGPATATEGVRSEPLRRSEQVGLLEAGVVLVQHRNLEPDALRTVEALGAGDGVLVVPKPELPAPIVVTAWLNKLVCASLDPDASAAIAAFADEHRGQAPGPDG